MAKVQKKQRNFEATRKLILKNTFEEVFRSGFQGVSIDDIVARTKLTKGALYHQFPTKLDLGYALIEEVITPMIIDRWIKPLHEYENPLEGIMIQMEKLIGQAKPSHLKLGCPLNNLVQEMAPVDLGFKKRLQRALNLWISETDKLLQKAKADGFIKAQVNTSDAAHFIVMAHEGFYGMIKGLDNRKVFNALYNSLKQYFNLISVKTFT